MSIMETDWRIKESNKQWIYVLHGTHLNIFLMQQNKQQKI